MSRLPIGNLGAGQLVRSNGIALVGLTIGTGFEVSGTTLNAIATGAGTVGPTGPTGPTGPPGSGSPGVAGPTGPTGPAGGGGTGDSVLTWMNL